MGKHEHDEGLWKDAEWSKARKKTGVHQSMKGQFTIKYLIFMEIWKLPCVAQNFPVFSIWKNWWPNSCFPRVVATLSLVSKKVAIGLTVIFTLQIVMLNTQENYVHPNCGFEWEVVYETDLTVTHKFTCSVRNNFWNQSDRTVIFRTEQWFLAHLGYFPMSLCNHDSWMNLCAAYVYTSPGQSINLSNFIFCRYIT